METRRVQRVYTACTQRVQPQYCTLPNILPPGDIFLSRDTLKAAPCYNNNINFGNNEVLYKKIFFVAEK